MVFSINIINIGSQYRQSCPDIGWYHSINVVTHLKSDTILLYIYIEANIYIGIDDTWNHAHNLIWCRGHPHTLMRPHNNCSNLFSNNVLDHSSYEKLSPIFCMKSFYHLSNSNTCPSQYSHFIHLKLLYSEHLFSWLPNNPTYGPIWLS